MKIPLLKTLPGARRHQANSEHLVTGLTTADIVKTLLKPLIGSLTDGPVVQGARLRHAGWSFDLPAEQKRL